MSATGSIGNPASPERSDNPGNPGNPGDQGSLRDQLALSLHLPQSAELEDFVPGANAEALRAVRLVAGGLRSQLLLHGPAGEGRSHLLLGAAHAAARSGRRCAWINPGQPDHEPEMLAGVEDLDLVCIDDLHRALDTREWTLALLRALDALRRHATPTLLASELPPERLNHALPDLRTRLTACLIYGLQPLDDPGRRELLQRQARKRGLDLADDAADYLVRHLPRHNAALLQALETADAASLREKRRLTIPFLQRVLGGLQA